MKTIVDKILKVEKIDQKNPQDAAITALVTQNKPKPKNQPTQKKKKTTQPATNNQTAKQNHQTPNHTQKGTAPKRNKKNHPENTKRPKNHPQTDQRKTTKTPNKTSIQKTASAQKLESLGRSKWNIEYFPLDLSSKNN